MLTWQMNWNRNTARKNNANGVLSINIAGKAPIGCKKRQKPEEEHSQRCSPSGFYGCPGQRATKVISYTACRSEPLRQVEAIDKLLFFKSIAGIRRPRPVELLSVQASTAQLSGDNEMNLTASPFTVILSHRFDFVSSVGIPIGHSRIVFKAGPGMEIGRADSEAGGYRSNKVNYVQLYEMYR